MSGGDIWNRNIWNSELVAKIISYKTSERLHLQGHIKHKKTNNPFFI